MDDLAKTIVRNLTDDLRKPEYRGHPNILFGQCYVASEVFFHLSGGKEACLTPMRVKHEGTTHWWVRRLIQEWGKNKLYQDIDLTAAQFETKPPYYKGIATGFLTKNPSKRAQELILRVQEEQING